VKRRLKDKAFAKGSVATTWRKGAEELGMPLEEHIAFCIAAMPRASRRPGPPRHGIHPSRLHLVPLW